MRLSKKDVDKMAECGSWKEVEMRTGEGVREGMNGEEKQAVRMRENIRKVKR